MRPLPADSPIQVDSWLSEDDERTLANDVLDGLTKPFKELAPKHFYDARGSQLFEQICELPEYYPTRTELAILSARAADIVESTRAGELGVLLPPHDEQVQTQQRDDCERHEQDVDDVETRDDRRPRELAVEREERELRADNRNREHECVASLAVQ